MKKMLPNPEPISSNLFGLHYQVVNWELLITAIKLSLFDLLSEPASATEVSNRLQTEPTNTTHMLNALVGLGCLTKKEQRYQNTTLAETYLTDGKDTYLGRMLLFRDRWNQSILNGGLMDMVKNGPPPSQDLADEALWEKGARASVNYSRCGRAQGIAALVAELPEFPGFKRIMDMGSGPGIIGIAIASIHPSLECVLFDRAAVITVADELVAEYGLEDRVKTIGGDYMNDPIDGKYDLIMANYTLNFYIDRLDELIRKIYQSLNPGGLFMVLSDGLNKDRTAPAECVISWLSTALAGHDLSFQAGMVAEKMLKAGFRSTERRALPSDALDPHGSVELTIGRKGALT